MKKYLCLLIALLLLLSACGRNTAKPAQPAQSPAADGGAPENPNPAPEQAEKAPEPVQNEVKEPEPHHPYEWLGLAGMPECSYLDILSTNHYYQVFDSYTPEGKEEVIDAADGIDAYRKTGGTTTLTVGGMIYSISEAAKSYMAFDQTAMAAQAKANMESIMKNGANMTGRAFQDTGRSAVPLLPEDSAEYEYYEFQTSNPGVSELTERFFMKDGDVFAIYSVKETGGITEEHTDLIKSITADIPAGTFDIPDLSEYTRTN